MDDKLNPRKRPRDDNEISEEDVKQKQEKHDVVDDDKKGDISVKESQTGSHQYFELNIEDLVEVRDLLKTNHFVDSKWLDLGLQLGLLMNTLKTIEAQYGKDVSRCLLECLSLWLQRVDKVDERGGPNWDTLANALSKVGERFSADNARQKVKEAALQRYISSLSQSTVNPVKVAQLLYSERCISEATLDEMEKLKVSLDEKKMTLVSAIHTAVSSHNKKLKVLAEVLSKFKETKLLSDKIISEYIRKFPDDQMTVDNVSEVVNDQLTDEDHASDILRRHYGTLSQYFHCPVSVAQLLHGEKIISQRALSAAQSSSEDEASFLLLKAVRDAVHDNYHKLVVFASVLLKFTSSVPCANAILKDCEEVFPDLDMPSIQPINSGTNEGTTLAVPVESSSSLTQDEAQPIPRRLRRIFGSSRKEFALAFSKIRKAINASPPPLDELKQFLEDGYSHLQPQFVHCNSIDEVLRIVKDHCTLIDISCLEGIVERFDIKEAETHIQVYKNFIQSLCEKTKACLCLNENFKVTKTPSLLRCETVEFVLDWEPKSCTLEDIKDILSESLEMNVQIRYIREGNSIIVICFFPLSPAILIFIAKAQETLEVLKKKGLLKLTVGYCTIYDKCKRDEEIIADREEIEKLRGQLEMQQTIIKKQTMEIESIKDKQGKVELATSMETSEDVPDVSCIFKRVPDEHDVLSLLVDIDNKWYEIGLSLKVSRHVLNHLQRSQESNIVKLDRVIQSWITNESCPVTWETVIDAIEGPIVSNKNLATEIREHLADAELKRQSQIEQIICRKKTMEVESIAKNQEEKVTLTSELSERDKQELKQSSEAQEPVSPDQVLEEIQIISSPETSTPTISENTELKDQFTDVKESDKDFLEKEDDKTVCKGRYFREITETSLHDLPHGVKRETEVLFRSHHITHYPWKKCEHVQHTTTIPIFQYIDSSNFNIPLQRVHIAVDKLCHITHELSAREISRANYFNFKPTHIVGRAGYSYDGSPVGETFVICEPTDQPPTEETEYRHVSSGENIFPGCYSWWSIDHQVSCPPSSDYYYSDFFTESSRYGNVKFSGYIMQLLQCYQKAYNTNPLPRIQFRCGGTLRYKKEICKVVIVCTDAHPLAEDEFPIIWDDILYDKNGRVAVIKPFQVVIKNGISGDRRSPILYSWDTYAFGFYFPNKKYRLRCPKSENFERSEIEHYDESCIKKQPDSNNDNKLTCPNRFLDDSESDKSDEEEYVSHKKQQQ